MVLFVCDAVGGVMLKESVTPPTSGGAGSHRKYRKCEYGGGISMAATCVNLPARRRVGVVVSHGRRTFLCFSSTLSFFVKKQTTFIKGEFF